MRATCGRTLAVAPLFKVHRPPAPVLAMGGLQRHAVLRGQRRVGSGGSKRWWWWACCRQQRLWQGQQPRLAVAAAAMAAASSGSSSSIKWRRRWLARRAVLQLREQLRRQRWRRKRRGACSGQRSTTAWPAPPGRVATHCGTETGRENGRARGARPQDASEHPGQLQPNPVAIARSSTLSRSDP